MKRLTHKDKYAAFRDGAYEKNQHVAYYECIDKLGEYEDLEEQGHLIRIPCKIGDTIYVIPSKVTHDINVVNGHEERNHVYKQVVFGVVPGKRGYAIYTCDGQSLVLEEEYRETWFLTEEEAQATLREMEGN